MPFLNFFLFERLVVTYILQIYTNGYVTLGNDFNSGRPRLLMDQTELQAESMVAPFWSDIDMSSDSRVWYHFYNKFSAKSLVSLRQAQSLIVQNYKDPAVASGFDPNTALVVTWENVRPAPASIHSTQVL